MLSCPPTSCNAKRAVPTQRAAAFAGELPTITLVTPVLNGWRYLSDAIESVLRQEYPSLEYIVVDGGSTDGTLDIIRGYQQRKDLPQRISQVIPGPDKGMYDAVAKGFAVGRGEIFAYLNCDDLLEPGALMHAGRFLAGRRDVDAVYHDDIVLVNGWKYANYAQPERVDFIHLLQGHVLNQAGVFFRRALYEKAGGVRRDLRMAGDYDLWLRLAAIGRFAKGVAHLSVFRVRPGQLSGDMAFYNGEVDKARREFLGTMPAGARAVARVRAALRRKRDQFAGDRHGSPRPFFPLDFYNMAAPATQVTWPPTQDALSPIDGARAERFLLTVPGTRGDVVEGRHFHLDTRHRIAVAAQRAHRADPWSKNPPAAVSPFVHYDTRRLWQKALFRFPLERMPRRLVPLVGISDSTFHYIYRALAKAGVPVATPLRVLDVAAGKGVLLRQCKQRTPWVTTGLGVVRSLRWSLRSKGHDVRDAEPGALEAIPADERFDVVLVDDYLDRIVSPRALLDKARALLSPHGVVLVVTANLDSQLLEWHGPAWSEWDAPRRESIFSLQALRALAAASGLEVASSLTCSPSTSIAATLVNVHSALNGARVRMPLPPALANAARRMAFWLALGWNRIGRGERIVAVLRPATPGR
jgi:glycosyltransferase involved in cell wall biosynthesis/2-polyprenyl-3-methyl-5-hydroxy-6-metoxy-1,4-benzoquinol methylase